MSRFLSPRRAALIPYTPGEQPRMSGLIKLNTNESPYPPSPRVVEAITQESLAGLRLYSDIQAEGLTRAIAERYGLEQDQVLAGNGSDEILSFAFQAFGERGVAFPDITYGFYAVWAALYGCPARVVPLAEDFTVPLPAFMSNRETIFLANPNAPTGIALPSEAVRGLLDANPDQVVVVDEAYVDFGAQSVVPLIRAYENLLVVQTFSKSRQLAGARLGFAMGSKALIDDLRRIKFSFNPYNVNSLTQRVGEAAMRDEAYFAKCCALIAETRERTAAALRALGFDVLPSRANFLFAAPRFMEGGEYMRALKERNILVRHFDGKRTRDYVRITIGTQAQMDELVRVTKELMT